MRGWWQENDLVAAVGFEDGGKSLKPRTARRLEAIGKQVLPWSPQKGMKRCQHLDFSLGRPSLDF